MLLILFAFWLLLNGTWTTEIAVTGVVISVLIYVFLCCFVDYSPRKEWYWFKRLVGFVKYAVFMLGEIYSACMQTISLIWAPGVEVEPELTTFRTELKTEGCKAILANSITMTPGTITVMVRDDMYIVHALDSSFTEGLEHSNMEKHLLEIEGGKTK